MACGAMGWASRLAVQQGATLDTGGEPFHFLRESITFRQMIRRREVITGKRGVQSNTLKNGLTYSLGSIWLEPTPAVLDVWLPLILGGAESSDVFDFADTVPAFTLGKDLDTDLYQYGNCYVNRAVFSSASNGQLTLRLDIVGGLESDLGAWPAFTKTIGDDVDDQPYGHEEVALTLNGNAHIFWQHQLTIDNNLTPKIVNSAVPDSWCPSDNRVVTYSAQLPFATANELGLYNTVGRTEIAGAFTYTNGNVSTLFNMPNMRNQPRTPNVRNKGEIPHQMNFFLTEDSAASELQVTNDSNAAS